MTLLDELIAEVNAWLLAFTLMGSIGLGVLGGIHKHQHYTQQAIKNSKMHILPALPPPLYKKI